MPQTARDTVDRPESREAKPATTSPAKNMEAEKKATAAIVGSRWIRGHRAVAGAEEEVDEVVEAEWRPGLKQRILRRKLRLAPP